MLRLSETKTVPTDPISAHLSFTEASVLWSLFYQKKKKKKYKGN